MPEQTYSCERCEKSFTRFSNRDYRFCSKRCAYDSHRGKPRPSGRSLREHRCQWCGTTFSSPRSGGARSRYCSYTCQGFGRCKHRPPQPLSPTEAAYIAAMIDGEGCIQLLQRRADLQRLSLRVSIAGTCGALHDWLLATTGTGRICRVARRPGWKPCFQWQVYSIAAVGLLEQTLPYLIEKRARAEEALASQPHQASPASAAAVPESAAGAA